MSLLWLPARKYAIIFGAAETMFVYGALSATNRSVRWYLALFVGATATWVFTLGFPYTYFSDWILNATGSTGFALPAFFVAFSLALFLAVSQNPKDASFSAKTRVLQFAIAAIVFLVLGLRIDNETALWIPYHQSYFTAPADLVRAHHWLLWDIPSQYGFLSVLTLAALPTATVFDSIYLLTALSLFCQAMMAFILLTIRRGGWANFVFALLLCFGAFYTSQAAYYPFGARLYPQEGLRFIWPLAALFCAFWHFRASGMISKRLAIAAGNLSWILSILWSFETGVWTSVIWIAFLIGDSVTIALTTESRNAAFRALGARFALLTALFVTAFGIIEFVYFLHFGHGPDWRSYFEFSAIYAGSGQFVQPVDPFGPVWTLALVLIAVTSLMVVDIRQSRYRRFPVLLASWAAIWATSSYFVGEAFNQHVAMLSGMLISVGAIIFYVTEADEPWGLTTLLSRLSFVPVSVFLIAYAIGAPSHLMAMRWPPMGNIASSFSSTLPPISGELLTLERRAGIKPNDLVLYPSRGNWNKLSSGVILPIVRGRDGKLEMQTAWLPMSPVGEYNTLTTLPLFRQGVYIARYLDDSSEPHGWLIAYREPAVCSSLSPNLKAIKHFETANYRAVYCVTRTTFAAPLPPVLTSVPGGISVPHSDYVRITYVTRAGQTLPSGESVNSLGANALTVVQPPMVPSSRIIGYNVYAVRNNGGSGTGETLQNNSPIPPNASYTEPVTGWATTGAVPPIKNTAAVHPGSQCSVNQERPPAPFLTWELQGTTPAHSDYVKIAYVFRNGESLPSKESVNSLGNDSITIVQPPTCLPKNAMGYDVYAIKNNGGSRTGETLQNKYPVPPNTAFTEPESGWTTTGGAPPTRSKTGMTLNAHCALSSGMAAAPVLTWKSLGTAPAHSDYVKITYAFKNWESLPSKETVNSLGKDATTIVRSPICLPKNAIGYNVYAVKNNGGSGMGETLQNKAPIPLGVPFQEPIRGWHTRGRVPPGAPEKRKVSIVH
ncbi:MAG: hypothetical protein ACYDA1_01900 [Vulcanimicrobiaceae bacterium]